MDSSSSGDFKSCQCRKNRCLNRLCGCFAAVKYCDEFCSCQGCNNSQTYQEDFKIAQRKALSRNPFAFNPEIRQTILAMGPCCKCKTVRCLTGICCCFYAKVNCGEWCFCHECLNRESSDGGTRFPPEEEGCCCKKSQCVRGHCQCFQAQTKCSEGCRCIGCGNTFGRKGEHAGVEDVAAEEVSNEVPDSSSDKKMADEREVLLHDDPSAPHNLAPIPPSFLFSGYCGSHDSEIH